MARRIADSLVANLHQRGSEPVDPRLPVEARLLTTMRCQHFGLEQLANRFRCAHEDSHKIGGMNLRNIWIAGAVAAITAVATPASAEVDAFESFSGRQGAGGFFYGEINRSTLAFTPFTANTSCFITGSTCLQRAANGDVPGVTKSLSPSFQYGTVDVPDDRLLIHPAADGSILSVLFRASESRDYYMNLSANVQDRFPTGVNVGYIILSSITGKQLYFFDQINAANPETGIAVAISLGAGDYAGFVFDSAGSYFNDSVGVSFTVGSYAPEPATWAMMIGGFGMVGGAMRRRRSVSTKVSFA